MTILEMTGDRHAEMRSWRYPPLYDFKGSGAQAGSGLSVNRPVYAVWERVVKSNRNPLKACKSETAEQFTRSLVFRNGGLAGAYYGGVAKELTYQQFSLLWGVLGLGMGLFEDHKDMECKGQGTCEHANECVCTSNC